MKFIKNLIIYIVLPFMVASVLSLFALNFLGVKLPDNLRNVLPSFIVPGDKADKKIDPSVVKKLETTIQNQQDEMNVLQDTINDKEEQIDELTSKISGYKNLESNQTSNTETDSNEKENKKVIKIVQEMKAKDAAQVLNSMEEQKASAILSGLDQQVVADILSEMDPEQAAKYLDNIKD